MTASSIILASKGVQDEYIVGSKTPSTAVVNPFETRFVKYIPSVIQSFSFHFSEAVDWGKKLSFTVPKIGDYIHRIFLNIKVHPLSFASGDGEFASYTQSLGHACIEYVELWIGGILIDRHEGIFLDILRNLEGNTDSSNFWVGNNPIVKTLPYFYSASQSLWIPLQFFFNRNISQSLPLHEMPFQDIKIVLKLRPFSELTLYDGLNEPTETMPMDANLVCQYLYVDNNFLKKPGKAKNMVINQVQTNNPVIAQRTNQSINASIQFNHPVKHLFWVLIENDSRQNNDWLNYSNRQIPFSPLADSFTIKVDNEILTDNMPESFYRISNLNSPDKHIYAYSFSTLPIDKVETTGFFNFSTGIPVSLSSKLNSAISSNTVYLHIYAQSLNVIRFDKGFVKILFRT